MPDPPDEQPRSGHHVPPFNPFNLRYKGDTRFAAFCRKVDLAVPGETPARKST